MSDQLFFIDTNPDEDPKEENVTIAEKEEKEVLGNENKAEAEKRRKNKDKERTLSKFLFGSNVEDEGVEILQDNESSAEEESSSDEEDDLDSAEDEHLQSDEEGEQGEEGSEVEEGNDDEEDGDQDAEMSDEAEAEEAEESASDDEGGNVQDLLPEDVFANNLNLGRGKKRKAAWKDEADDKVLVKDVAANFRKAVGKHGLKDVSTEKYGKSVERQFRSLVGEPKWAKLDREDEPDSDEEFFRETTDLIDKSRGGSLKTDYLEFRKLKDMNCETYREGTVIRSTEFHPTSTVGLVAGLNGTVSLSQIDGKNNPKIQTVNFKDFPIKTAKFSTDGNQVIAGSQHHSFLYLYDMIAGKISKVQLSKKINKGNTQRFEVSPDGKFIALKGRFGAVHLLSGRTKEFIRSLQMNDECQALKFSKQGSQLFTHGEGGEVYVWDVGSGMCVNKFVDDGCIAGSALAVNSAYLATGSSEGVVNIYNASKVQLSDPKPDKVILNLTTQINQMSFNPTGEILAISSELKDSAVKLVHFPTMRVFSNFPSDAINLHRINSLSFSPAGGYMSAGNNRGAALLYRIKHYKDY